MRHPQGGPLWLLGHSAGALVALALAQRLEQQGLNLVTKNHCNLNSPSLKGMGKGEVKLMVKQPWVSHKKQSSVVACHISLDLDDNTGSGLLSTSFIHTGSVSATLLCLSIDICYSQWFDALAAEARSAGTTGNQVAATVGFDLPTDSFSTTGV